MRKPAIERPFYLKKLKSYTGSDIIRVITGVRRCGKSSLLLIYKAWLEEQYGEGSVIYLSFDGPDFILDKSIYKMTDSIKSVMTNDTRFMLLDEVQLMEGWETVVNAYYSTGQYEITITGSNAKMLSSELATMLTGRYMEIEMFPLSFYEYSQFKFTKPSCREFPHQDFHIRPRGKLSSHSLRVRLFIFIKKHGNRLPGKQQLRRGKAAFSRSDDQNLFSFYVHNLSSFSPAVRPESRPAQIASRAARHRIAVKIEKNATIRVSGHPHSSK